MGSWIHEALINSRTERLMPKLEKLTREELIARIIKLEATLYPFAYTLGSFTENAPYGTCATSKLFAMKSDDKKFIVPDPDSKQGDAKEVTEISEANLHSVRYLEEDSLVIFEGEELHNNFAILEVSQNGKGGVIGCGSITIGDIRRARDMIFPETTEGTESNDDARKPGVQEIQNSKAS